MRRRTLEMTVDAQLRSLERLRARVTRARTCFDPLNPMPDAAGRIVLARIRR